jgi:uncharacterized damage-inducible protein DinB
MSDHNEITTFIEIWNAEAKNTLRVLESLPADQYDFRAEPKGRSIGELAWHLCEIDACISFGVAERRFSFADRPPNLTRPREVELLAPGFRLIHDEAVPRLKGLKPEHLDETVTYFDGKPMKIREVLWEGLLHHLIHHRAQLVLMCRMAGGTPPGLYGPNREEMEAMRAQMESGSK